jgi:serine/threonine protein kinase
VSSRSTSNRRRTSGATEPEQVLSGRYLLGPSLGRGGMATVYRGEDLLLGRVVAVKVLAPSFQADADFVERFRREAQAAASLNHPNVVSVFDTGSDGDVHYIVMEYVEGATLADVLREEGTIAPRHAAEIAVAICSALEAAHDRGLVHRDIKPGNVMVTPTGTVKVMDFGIARAASAESFTRPGIVLGTAWYLSPEQARGLPADARSDLYSVGCVLYEMLTGQPPFLGDSPVAVAYQHVSERPPRLTKIDPAIPPALEAIAKKALAKDPARRYQTAGDMRGALESALESGLLPVKLAAATEPLPAEHGGTDALATVPISGPAPTDVLQADPLRDRARTRPLKQPQKKGGPPRWSVLLIAAVILAAAAFAIAWSLKGSPLAVPSQPPPATGTHSPTPPSAAAAYAALTQVIESGVQGGQISHKAGNDLLHRAGDILRGYQEGDLEEIGKKIDDLQGKIDEYAAKGDITSSNEAAVLHQAVSALANAVQAGESSSQGD